MNKPRTVSLTTEYEEALASGVPYPDYPRPQLKRDSYLCLNGLWDLTIVRKDEAVYSGKILVPFPPESRISGVMREIGDGDEMVYEREFVIDEGFVKDRLILHVGACDQYATVFVNGNEVGRNVGGYLPFSFDVTEYAVPGKNAVRIVAADPLDRDLPYGKQTRKRGGMWYTPVSGIWQTVWMESVPADYIEGLRITTDLTGANIRVMGGTEEKLLRFEGRECRFTGGSFRLEVESPRLWSPDDPHLYEFELISGDDAVRSYFGLRTVSVGERSGVPVILLNGEPIFFHGLLDQGYFSDGIFLPASPKGFEDDVLTMRSCGFNMLRKHIKLEPELFYYYCDRHGMLVFQDMINSGRYSFLLDTALPTVFLRRGITHRASKRRREEFERTCRGIVDRLYNHPSVVYYTIFNEGWGQFDADGYYDKMKAHDPTRIWDTTSGWFKAKKSDVESEHVYFKPVKLTPSKARPLVLSEFGGYSCKIPEHSFNLDKTYGYRYFDKAKDFEDALVRLYDEEIIPAMGSGLCAAVLTQVSDVEDETNGLVTYDRRIIKINESRMRELAKRMQARFLELYGGHEK